MANMKKIIKRLLLLLIINIKLIIKKQKNFFRDACVAVFQATDTLTLSDVQLALRVGCFFVFCRMVLVFPKFLF